MAAQKGGKKTTAVRRRRERKNIERGAAHIQSTFNNTIVTPCLLGMNSLYTLIHTGVVFFVGSGSLLASNPNAAFAVDLVLNQGKDLSNLLWEIIKYVKDILVYKATKKLEIYSKNEIEDIDKLSQIVTKERLLYIIIELSKLDNDMKWSSQKSILFQVEIIKLCSEEIIESTKEAPKKTITEQSTYSEKKVNEINKQEKEQDKKKEDLTQAISKFNEAKGWKNILNELRKNGKIMLYSNLLKAKPIEINDMTIGISFPEGLNAFGNDKIVGYGAAHIPIKAGKHELRVPLFAPQAESFGQKITAFFTGLYPELIDSNFVAQGPNREVMKTHSGGYLTMTVNVVLSDIESAGYKN